jgi:hypothetical protein
MKHLYVLHRDCGTRIAVDDADDDQVDSMSGAQIAAEMSSNSGSNIKMRRNQDADHATFEWPLKPIVLTVAGPGVTVMLLLAAVACTERTVESGGVK